jgi:hypothetical protein
MPELKPLPCPECGNDAQVIKIERNNNKPPVFVCLCKNHPCTDREAVYVSPEAAIAAWNALPRMSALIAWQFQAAGAALENQRLRERVEALEWFEEVRVYDLWGNHQFFSAVGLDPQRNQRARIFADALNEYRAIYTAACTAIGGI